MSLLDVPTPSSTITVAVAGNPNAGKSALFNAMTGIHQTTGNWPGVTVDRREGRYRHDGRRFTLVDLPGTYSLDGIAPDQQIARAAVQGDDVDVIVDVIDASNLERHLALTVQLAELPTPLVVALNMMDVAEHDGIEIDVDHLSAALDCEVVPVVATTGEGVDELASAITRTAGSAAPTRILETDTVTEATSTDSVEASAAVARAAARTARARDLAGQVTAGPLRDGPTGSDRVDRVVLHRIWGIPIFLGVMYLMFMFTINVGGAFIDAFDGIAGAVFVDGAREILQRISSPEWLIVALADGVGGGIQVVATFVPVIGALYLFLSLLEDSGYLARAAFVMDRAMRRIGLPGKAFVPMIVGFGCNVPAIMATRTLDDERERKLTILMNPFMSCGARLPVYALFAAAFFPDSGQNLVFLLYLIGIGVAIGTGLVMKHSLLRGRSEGFLMELPRYHRPTVRATALHTWHRLRVFIRKAGPVIVAMVTVLAVLNSVGTDGSFGNEDGDQSVLSEVGRTITPVFAPMGLEENNWPATVGIFTGVLAKEAVVGTLDSLYGTLAEQDAGVAEEVEPFEFWTAIGDSLATVPENLADVAGTVTDPLGLGVGAVDDTVTAAEEQEVDAGVYGAMSDRFDGQVGAFAYLLFVLLYLPCVAAIGAVVREAGRPWALFVAAWTTGVAYLVATGFYQAARFVDHPLSSTAWLAALAGVAVSGFVLLRRWASRRPEPVGVPVSVRRRG